MRHLFDALFTRTTLVSQVKYFTLVMKPSLANLFTSSSMVAPFFSPTFFSLRYWSPKGVNGKAMTHNSSIYICMSEGAQVNKIGVSFEFVD